MIKKTFIFVIVFFLLSIFLGGLFMSYSYSSEKDRLFREASDELLSIIELKKESINDYLFNFEKDIRLLSESQEIKSLMKQSLFSNESLVKMNIEEKVRIISNEVENYLIENPEMTLKDLQESSEFQEIIVHPFGKDVYTSAYDCDLMVPLFNEDTKLRGFNLYERKDESLSLWEIDRQTINCESDSNGFYREIDSDGMLRDKYKSTKIISVKTADDVSFALEAEVYVDDYKVIKNNSKNLEDFKGNLGYHNLILISPDGYIIYMADIMENFGESLEWEINLERGLSKNYFRVKESNNVSFFGPFVRHYGDIIKISAMVPVYDNKNLLGYAVLVDDIDKFFDVLEEISGNYKTGRYYLINSQDLLISHLGNTDFNILVQSIRTENSLNCFDESFQLHFEENESVETFLDYMGDMVLGTHREIKNMNWCLLGEINIKEILVPMNKFLMYRVFAVLIFVLIFSLIGFFIGNSFDRKYKGIKIRKFSCERRAKFRSWYCIMLGLKCEKSPRGVCFFIIKLRNYMKNLDLSYAFLFSVLFSLVYFFILVSFFEDWSSLNFYNLIPDSLALAGFMFLFIYSFKLKKEFAGKLIFIGALLSVLDRAVQMVLEGYLFHFEILLLYWWIPGRLLGYIGIILIFFGFNEVVGYSKLKKGGVK